MCPDRLNPLRIILQIIRKEKRIISFICVLIKLVLYRVFQQRKKKRSFMWLAYLHRIIIQDMYVQGKERRNYKFYESRLLQELLTLPKHLSSPSVFSGFHVTRSLVLCVCFVDHCLSFCTFSFGHSVVCSSLIYGVWLPPSLWCLQTLLTELWQTTTTWLRR